MTIDSSFFIATSGNPELGYPAWDPVARIYTDDIHLAANPAGAPEGVILPISVTLTSLGTTPAGGPLEAVSHDFGGGGVGSGWIYDSDAGSAGYLAEGVLDPGADRVTRTWEIHDSGALPWEFWADVHCAGVRAGGGEIRLGSFGYSILGAGGVGRAGRSGPGEFTFADGIPELHVGRVDGGLVVLNRFEIDAPAELAEISFYLGGSAVGSEVEAVVYFDPEGIASLPDGLEEVYRTTVFVEEPGFQVVPVEGVFLTPGASGRGAMFTGVGRAAFEMALQYTKERTQGGKLLFEHQLIKHKLFDMFTQVEAARALSRAALEYNLNNSPPETRYSIASKVFSTQAAYAVADQAVQILGGMGLSREHAIEKIYRDARAGLVEDGANDTLMITGAHMLDE